MNIVTDNETPQISKNVTLISTYLQNFIRSTIAMASTSKKNTASIFNLVDQFGFYGQYHANKYNVMIHVVCVPCILWTGLVMFNAIPLPQYTVDLSNSSLQSVFGSVFSVNFSVLYALANALYFMTLEPLAGLLYFPILTAQAQTATHFYFSNPDSHFYYALALHVVCWVAQFIGHGYFEGRAPALFDNLFQSTTLAVFFVWMEVLFVLGYRPALFREVRNKIGVNVVEYRKEHPKVRKGVSVKEL